MKNRKIENKLSINKVGTIGSVLSDYIDNYVSSDELEQINNKMKIINDKLSDF